jgi:hypothetical protein
MPERFQDALEGALQAGTNLGVIGVNSLLARRLNRR